MRDYLRGRGSARYHSWMRKGTLRAFAKAVGHESDLSTLVGESAKDLPKTKEFEGEKGEGFKEGKIDDIAEDVFNDVYIVIHRHMRRTAA